MTEREMARKKAAARKARARKQRTRRAVMTIALMLVVSVASIGGTIAWLTDKTGTVENTFTPSDINIELWENDKKAITNDPVEVDYKMVPGNVLTKDPSVTIKAGSEESWVFITVEEHIKTGLTFNKYLQYSVIDTDAEVIAPNTRKWTELTSASTATKKVYYCTVEDLSAEGATDVTIPVIGYTNSANQFVQDRVLVLDTVKKEDMEALSSASDYPTLTFKAAAVQKANITTVEAAFAQVKVDLGFTA